MLYKKYLLEEVAQKEIPEGEGIIAVATGNTIEEQRLYGQSHNVILGIYHAICRSLGIDDLLLETGNEYHALFKIIEHSDMGGVHGNGYDRGYVSQKLSRKKLIQAIEDNKIHEVAEAFIDLIKERELWKINGVYTSSIIKL